MSSVSRDLTGKTANCYSERSEESQTKLSICLLEANLTVLCYGFAFFLFAKRYPLYKAAIMLAALKSEWIKIGRNKEPLFSYA